MPPATEAVGPGAGQVTPAGGGDAHNT
jgi:hypothetical protein